LRRQDPGKAADNVAYAAVQGIASGTVTTACAQAAFMSLTAPILTSN
jgi:hypothetical protein